MLFRSMLGVGSRVRHALSKAFAWLHDGEVQWRGRHSREVNGNENAGCAAANDGDVAPHLEVALGGGSGPQIEIVALLANAFGYDAPSNEPAKHDASQAHRECRLQKCRTRQHRGNDSRGSTKIQ